MVSRFQISEVHTKNFEPNQHMRKMIGAYLIGVGEWRATVGQWRATVGDRARDRRRDGVWRRSTDFREERSMEAAFVFRSNKKVRVYW